MASISTEVKEYLKAKTFLTYYDEINNAYGAGKYVIVFMFSSPENLLRWLETGKNLNKYMKLISFPLQSLLRISMKKEHKELLRNCKDKLILIINCTVNSEEKILTVQQVDPR